MRQNEKAIVGLCVVAVVVGAFLVLHGYGRKAASEAESGSNSAPRGTKSMSPAPAPPAPISSTENPPSPPPAATPPGLIGLPPVGLDSKVYPVDEKYDRAHDVMTFAVTNLKTEDARFTLVSVRWMEAGESPVAVPTSVHFTFSTQGAERKLDESDEVSLVADGKPLIPGTTKVQSKGGGGSILEYLSMTLATQDFLDFANARHDARVKVGGFDFGVGAEERRAMLSLASRFPRAPK